MRNEFRHAIRSLLRDRAFACMVVLSLAVGIGANTAIFSLVDGVLLRPPEYRDCAGGAHARRSDGAIRGATPFPDDVGPAVRRGSSGVGGIWDLRRAVICRNAAYCRDGHQGMLPVLAGLPAGAGGALAIGRYLESMLFRVSPRDPVAFGVSGAVLLLAAAAACMIPARRATRVNPIDALRFE